MDDQLTAIKNAVEATDFDTARTLADAYVADNPDVYSGFEAFTQAELVARIDAARATENTDQLWLTEAWLLHGHEPQNISGTYQPRISIASFNNR